MGRKKIFHLRSVRTSLLVQDDIMAGYLFPNEIQVPTVGTISCIDSIHSETITRNCENCSAQFSTEKEMETL